MGGNVIIACFHVRYLNMSTYSSSRYIHAIKVEVQVWHLDVFIDQAFQQWCHSRSPSSNKCSQEKFQAVCKKIHTKKEAKKTSIEEGWYTREEMSKVLHWNVFFGINKTTRSTYLILIKLCTDQHCLNVPSGPHLLKHKEAHWWGNQGLPTRCQVGQDCH